MENKKWLRTYVPVETHQCLLTESQSRGITIGELINQLLVYNGLDELRDLPEHVYGVAFERKKKEDYYNQLHNISQYIDDLLRHGYPIVIINSDPNAQRIRFLAERIQKMIKL